MEAEIIKLLEELIFTIKFLGSFMTSAVVVIAISIYLIMRMKFEDWVLGKVPTRSIKREKGF